MFNLGSPGGKYVKPSFVSYVTPEEIKVTRMELPEEKRGPDFLPGEVVFCSADRILKCAQEEMSQGGVFGTLLCTNFRISFVSDKVSWGELDRPFKNKLYGGNDIPLSCVDHIYGEWDEKKKLIMGGQLKNKYPSKIIIYCKDLRVFQFSLKCAEEDVAKKIFQGIVRHSLEPKSLKCVFAFSYCEEMAASSVKKRNQRTVMFDSVEDWAQEMNRTKGDCKLLTDNENFSISPKLPQFFIVPKSFLEEDLQKFEGKGIPIWCWSHHSGCGLFKTASFPLMQEDESAKTQKAMYMERMLRAVAQNHLYSVCTEELSETLPNIQEIQQSYNKFKQCFLIENIAEFWLSDVKWLSTLESSGWLNIIRQCLQKAVEVVEYLERGNTNVLLIEEEGSDLCCVISSLVQLMLDPHYRTLTGFQSLLQKEWVAGGHSFLDRCDHLQNKDKELQSPVFLLFLECVWQLLQQYSPAFQFSETYLTVLSDSVHVAIFSTFLFNSPHHRATILKAESPQTQRGPLNFPTVWDWSLQFDREAQDFLMNPMYREKLKQDKGPRKICRPKHQRQMSLPSSSFKSPSKKGFFKEETESLKKILRVKKISRWIGSPDSTPASTHEFFSAWLLKPLDYHGLLLPCLEGPAIRLWMQRYLRWIQQVQILGGGEIAITRKVSELSGEVQELRMELDRLVLGGESCRKGERMPKQLSAHLSSSFPFTGTCGWSFRPAIPTHAMTVGQLTNRDDEDTKTFHAMV